MKNSIVSPIKSPIRSPIIGGGDSQTAPVLLSAIWYDASPSQIELTFNKNVVSANYPLGVSITINAVPATLLTSGTISPSNVIKIDFAETLVFGNTVLVSYDSIPGDWAGENAIEVESFTDITVTEIVTPVAPVLTLPTDEANGPYDSTGTVTTDQDSGTLYFYISTSATPPSIGNLKSGTGAIDFGNQSVIAVGVQNIIGDGLIPDTTYYTHYLHTNAEALDSNLASANGFTTEALVAPILTLPTDDANGGIASTGTVTTDQGNGTLYFYISESATPPSAGDLKAGTGATDFGNQTVIATGLQNVNGDGLTSETTYYTHYLHTNTEALDSNISSADGFTTADITQPTLTLPTDDTNGATAYTGTVTSNEGNGTLYWYVSTSATAPSLAELKAGTGSADSGNQAVIASGVQNVSGNTLTAETTYYIHYAQTDAGLNDSAIVSADGFTTEAASTGDPDWASVVLLTSMEGLNGGTTFTDEKGRHTITPVNGSTTTTVDNPGQFNNGCLKVISTSGNISVADNGVDYDFGVGDFTVEIALYSATGSPQQVQIIGSWNQPDPEWQIYTNGSRFPILIHSSLGDIFVSSTVLSNDVWQHLAVTRKDGIFYMYIDGVNVATNSALPVADFNFTATNTIGIGKTDYQNGFGAVDWNLNWCRITKGVARYSGAGSFTPPTEGYPTGP